MATGPSTAQTPYLVPTRSGVSFTSIISAGDGLPGSTWKLVGIPDGMGAFDNGDGTFTVLVNHETRRHRRRRRATSARPAPSSTGW